jgi:hypothetical protein
VDPARGLGNGVTLILFAGLSPRSAGIAGIMSLAVAASLRRDDPALLDRPLHSGVGRGGGTSASALAGACSGSEGVADVFQAEQCGVIPPFWHLVLLLPTAVIYRWLLRGEACCEGRWLRSSCGADHCLRVLHTAFLIDPDAAAATLQRRGGPCPA